MTAVVVGSTRMDTLSGNGSEDPFELAKTDSVSTLGLTLEEKLFIMDKLLTLQATYHEGTGLGRSLYTCVLLFNLERLRREDAVLYDFCMTLATLASNLKDLVLNAHVCEDEDFNILTQGLPTISSSTSVDDSRTKVESMLAEFISKPNPDPKMKGLTVMLARAMLSRLRFVKYLLLGIKCITHRSKQALTESSRYFSDAENEFKTILATQNLKQETSCGFHEKLSTGGHHMRFSNILSLEESWSHFQLLLDQLKTVSAIIHISNYKELKNFVVSFSNGYASAIPRSALYLQLDDRHYTSSNDAPRWVPTSRMLGEVFGIPSSKLPTLGQDVLYFLEQAMIGIQNWICCLCLNQYRQRRRLKRGLEDWRRLYDHAQAADTSSEFLDFMSSHHWNWPLANNSSTSYGPFTVWVEKETSLVMVRHLFLGFEQKLYNPNEYLSIFWYCDYLLTKVIMCTRELFNIWPTEISTSNKKQIKAHQQLEIIRSQKHSLELALLELEQCMCQGLTRVMLALRLAKIVDLNPLPFNEELNRFEQRFLSFWVLEHPEPLDFAAFHASTSPEGTNAASLFVIGARFFALTKDKAISMTKRGAITGLGEDDTNRINQIEKVAKTNELASKLLEKLTATGAKINVKFNFEMDKHFPSLAISR
eukprot:g7032.t1